LQGTGNQVIDLEGIANHKGSAFGALGQPPQPSSEYFSNLLYEEWRRTEREDPVWLEDESKNIGTVFMPDPFYSHIRNSPAIILLMSIENRIPRLIEEYSSFQPEKLKESIMRISKRLGGDNTREAISAVESGNFAKAIEITLTYYDKTYLYGISKHHSGNIIFVETDTNDIDINAQKVLEAAGKIKF
jgi:tRNA 2-selenouridine synthase